ncbi:uncharacterized protein V1516DRAFT_669828 [Lipomyces oligophaga]|uniref:uncharacterized protein n=1 Tax=Lipomyces oligophaga TaxID=45792 RepID=UPI0034CD3F88
MESRRVWVRRPHGIPTTIMVAPNDLVDDLKTALIHKYAIGLGRIYDAPELIIRLPHRPSTHHNSPHGRRRRRGDVVRRELANIESSSAAHTSRRFHRSGSPSEDDDRILEPDEIVYSILELYFPSGMEMKDAFIIEVFQVDSYPNGFGQVEGYETYGHDGTQSTQSLPDYSSFQQHGEENGDLVFQNNNQHYRDTHGGRKPSGPLGNRSPAVAQSSIPIATLAAGASVVRPQPQPIQQLGEQHGSFMGHYGNNKHLAEEDHTSRSQSPHRHSARSIHSVAHSVSSGTTAQIQASNLLNKSPLQNVTSHYSENGPESESLREDGSSSGVESNNLESPDKDAMEKPAGPSATNSSQMIKSTSGIGKPPTSNESSSLLDGIIPPIQVLIVEDNIINQKILETFMRRRKIRCNVAKNGKEAIEKWREGGYHLVLMDIQLPVLSGIEATKEIRRLERRNRIGVFADQDPTGTKEEDLLAPHRFKSPVIIVALTASSLDSDRKEALAAGCNDFLIKPVNLVWLERKITEWGCMQALIDFEGWRQWKGTDEAEKDSNAAARRRPKPTSSRSK